jgi:hypothetical protein
MTLPKLHTQPEHDPIPSQNPTEPQQEVPDHDPPPFPEKAEVLFDEDEVAK